MSISTSKQPLAALCANALNDKLVFLKHLQIYQILPILNGKASAQLADAPVLLEMNIKHIYTKPYQPQANCWHIMCITMSIARTLRLMEWRAYRNVIKFPRIERNLSKISRIKREKQNHIANYLTCTAMTGFGYESGSIEMANPWFII